MNGLIGPDDATSANDETGMNTDRAGGEPTTSTNREDETVMDADGLSSDSGSDGASATAHPSGAADILSDEEESEDSAVTHHAALDGDSSEEGLNHATPADSPPSTLSIGQSVAGADHDMPSTNMDDAGNQHEPSEAKDTPYLEEKVMAPTTPAFSGELSIGQIVTWGGLEIEVTEALAFGWYGGLCAGRPVRIWPGDLGLVDVPAHPILANIEFVGEDGIVVGQIDGDPGLDRASRLTAISSLLALAQLVRFFQAQGLSVIDIAPESLVMSDGSLRLSVPPRLASIGKPLPRVFRDGYTPPEIHAGEVATGNEGVYILGALLYEHLTGHRVPPEGVTRIELSGIPVPGFPQLLFRALREADARIGAAEFVDKLRAVQVSLENPTAGAGLPQYEIGVETTVGLNPERDLNEDSSAFLITTIGTHIGTQTLIQACVADGMGGEEAGELASAAAVQAFCVQSDPSTLTEANRQVEATEQLAWTANQAVLQALGRRNGGCTLTGVVIVGNRLSVAHVGDSRAYLYSKAGLTRITKDHSLVSALIALGQMSEEEAESSPDRNTILRSLGSLRTPQAKYIDRLTATQENATYDLEPGDVIIICSDGVHGYVDDESIEMLVKQSRGPHEISAALVGAALEAGAPDNATALTIKRN